jgi:glycosyltransferase involved in cell wall biosynthesis
LRVVIFLENNQKGGLDTFCSTLVNAWADYRDSFVVVCNASHPGLKQLRDSLKRNCEFYEHEIPLSWVLSKKYFRWLPSALRQATQPLLRIILFPFQYRRLQLLFSQLDGDALLVINGGFPGGETCRIANIAWGALDRLDRKKHNIHNFHNYAVAPRRGLGWYENWIDRLLANSAGRLISVSRSCAESLRIRQSFHSSTAIGHIYNGICSNNDSPAQELPDLRRDLGIGDAPLCLILANFEPRKGHRFLFKAFAMVAAKVPEVHLVACGGSSGNERKVVEASQRELAPAANVHFLDFVPGGAGLIDQVDLVAISSQTFESFGLTAVEAMARGVPVVSTRIGGLPEVIGENGDGGYTAPADDPAKYAELIVQLLRDPKLRLQVGERGRKRAAVLFTADRMAAEYHKVLVAGADPEGSSIVPRLHGEWYYVLRRCLGPAMALESAAVVVSALRRRLSNRLMRHRDIHYPAQVKSCAAAVRNLPVRHQLIVEEPPPALPDGPRRLKLAAGYLYFDEWPNWGAAFSDHEQLVSLHRWNWLLRALTDEVKPIGADWGLALIRSWISAMTVLPRGDVGESYSTGERISNACIFARHTSGRWDGFPTDIASALVSMAADLAQRIEYHDGELSGNHVINNGRALLFAGHCFARPELLALGRALLIERLPALISEGVFLREGSSHYQFLFTRWLLELRLLAKETGDAETSALIVEYLPGLVEGCGFFLVNATNGGVFMPTFGDISPDCDPEWLLDLLKLPIAYLNSTATGPSNNLHGWAMLLSDRVLSNLEVPRQKVDTSFWRAYQQAGWYRLDFNGWVAIWRIETPGGPTIASHAHHDGCSFVLYRHGKEVLIDPGRLNYGKEPLGRYGFSGDAHNSLTLDGRPPLLSRGDRFIPERHRRTNCVVTCHEFEGMIKVSIEHDGFTRLGGGIERHTRNFTFSSDQVEIVDCFEGIGYYWMDARFHRPLKDSNKVAPGFYSPLPDEFESEIWLQSLDIPSKICESSLVAFDHPIGGWRFPKYGIKSAALTQRFVGPLTLPVECRYLIGDKKLAT